MIKHLPSVRTLSRRACGKLYVVFSATRLTQLVAYYDLPKQTHDVQKYGCADNCNAVRTTGVSQN